MSVSTKELFTAFFKGLAFAKGLNFGDKNRGMAQDRWITIHPGGDEDNYRRIEIDDDGTILKGGAVSLQGTNIKDLSKNFKDKESIEGRKFKTSEEYNAKEEKIKSNVEKIKQAINSGKKADIDNAKKLIAEMGAFRLGRPQDTYEILQQLKKNNPDLYKTLLDTNAHHDKEELHKLDKELSDVQRAKDRELFLFINNLESLKNNGRYNVLLKEIEENKELLEHLPDDHNDYARMRFNSYKKWAEERKQEVKQWNKELSTYKYVLNDNEEKELLRSNNLLDKDTSDSVLSEKLSKTLINSKDYQNLKSDAERALSKVDNPNQYWFKEAQRKTRGEFLKLADKLTDRNRENVNGFTKFEQNYIDNIKAQIDEINRYVKDSVKYLQEGRKVQEDNRKLIAELNNKKEDIMSLPKSRENTTKFNKVNKMINELEKTLKAEIRPVVEETRAIKRGNDAQIVSSITYLSGAEKVKQNAEKLLKKI